MRKLKFSLFALPLLAAAFAKDLDVLCIYYPEWHVYPEWEAYYGKGSTEWQCVSNSVARFEGHHQPVEPVWGYYDESDPALVAKEIDLAADAGIDVFLYDWYWANKKPIQHEGLERGLRAAKKCALEDPKKPGAVLINAWNEYTEGSWLVPDKRNGDAYLKAVKRVFNP